MNSAPPVRKLDIFRVLAALDNKQNNFYSLLTDEEKKAFMPLLAARWMSGTFDPTQIVLLNEFANPYTFALYSHPQLLWHLLIVCNSGKERKYVWNKLPSRSGGNSPSAIKAISEYYGYNTQHAKDAMVLLSRSTIIDIAEQLGWQKEDITKIKREIKASVEKEDMEITTPISAVNNLLEF
jgi:hypothetical protein